MTENKPASGIIKQDEGAAIPREHNLLIAWWIALIVALTFIIGAIIVKPDPYWKIVLFIGDGLMVTFQITIVSMIFALLLGLLAGLGRTARVPWMNILASFYVEVIRGIPLLAQLFWIYYAMSRFIRLGPQVSAVLGLSICYGAYIGETFRAGIQSIPKGQMEAARALGLSRTQAMRYIIIPQAIRVVLPPVGNEFIAMLKDSSLVSVLAISDMLRRGREYASRTFAYFETYTLVALVYLLVTLVFSRVVFYIEQGMARQDKDVPVSVMHRLASVVVDMVVLDFTGLIVYGLLLPFSTWFPIGGLLAILMLMIAIAYVLICWTRFGRTPGMMAVGLRIVYESASEGQQLVPMGIAFKRLLLAGLPVPGLTLLGMWDRWGGSAFHDRWTQTTVVRD